MSSNHHTPYVNGTTVFESSSMNTPLGELDAAIGDYSNSAGKIPRVNSAETSFEYIDSIYDVGGCYAGLPGSDVVLMRFPFVRDINFPANLSGSKMIADTAATGSTVFSIQRNGLQVFTATFAASATEATFSGSQVVFQNNDILTIVAPNTPDATLADLGWCLALDKNVYQYTTTTTSSSTTTTTTA